MIAPEIVVSNIGIVAYEPCEDHNKVQIHNNMDVETATELRSIVWSCWFLDGSSSTASSTYGSIPISFHGDQVASRTARFYVDRYSSGTDDGPLSVPLCRDPTCPCHPFVSMSAYVFYAYSHRTLESTRWHCHTRTVT